MISYDKQIIFIAKPIVFLLVFFNVGSNSAFALSSDDKLPTLLSANSAICKRQNEEDICTYSGNAKLVQGTTNLQASQIIIYKKSSSKINRIVASGEYARYNTVADNKQQTVSANASTITIYPGDNTLVLEGNGQMTVGQDRFSANSAICKRRDDDNTCTYLGNAKFSRDTAVLQAQQIVIYEKNKGKDKDKGKDENNTIIASGEHSHYSDIVGEKRKPFEADADLITIYPDKKLMILTGRGQMTIGQDKYSGPHIEYKFK